MIEKFKKELDGYQTSRGTIQFPSDKGFPDALLKKIVKAQSERKPGVGLSRIESRLLEHCYTVRAPRRRGLPAQPPICAQGSRNRRWNPQHWCFDVADLYHRD